MNTDGKEKQCDSKAKRRISRRPRRRLVDLTLMAGTNRRECREERRKEGKNEPANRCVGVSGEMTRNRVK